MNTVLLIVLLISIAMNSQVIYYLMSDGNYLGTLIPALVVASCSYLIVVDHIKGRK